MNIDGETNLKLRKVPETLHSVVNGTSLEAVQHQLNSIKMDIVCEQPNTHIYKFEGM